MDAELDETLRIAREGGAESERQARRLLMSVRRVREERDKALAALAQVRRPLIPRDVRR